MRLLTCTGLLLLVAVACSTVKQPQTACSVNEPALDTDTNDIELCNGVVPIIYHVQLQPFLEKGHYQGHERISVLCENATDNIILHVNNSIQVLSSGVKIRQLGSSSNSGSSQPQISQGLESLSVLSTKEYRDQQLYVISLAQNLTQGASYEVELLFFGSLATNHSEGFFVNSYEDQKTSEKRWYAAVHKAQHILPCFDGSINKAAFEVNIVRPAGMRAFSNMPIRITENISDQAGLKMDRFQMTPLMSTSSLAIVLIDFAFITPSGSEVPLIRVFGREHVLSQLQGTADTVLQTIQFFQSYFRLPYPLTQLDIVVVPLSLPSPVNLWGVIILQEDSLIGTGMQPQLGLLIVKQWLGHMATPQLGWENEHISNALCLYLDYTWIETVAQTCDCSDYKSWDHSLYYEYGKQHPYDGLERMKEAIKTSKTQWIFKMLYYSLTENTFRKGLTRFLQNRQYKMYIIDDLFSIMTQQAWDDGTLPKHISVNNIMQPWLKNDRYPVVTVTRDYNDGTAEVEQHMLLRNQPKDDPKKDTLLWWVPIQYLSKYNLDIGSLYTVSWMEEQKRINITIVTNADSFIIVNPAEIGMFMVNYDLTNWNLLSTYLQESGAGSGQPLIDVVTREKLLHDAWNLAYSDELDFGTALNMTLFLKTEKEYAVLDNFFTMVDHVHRRISGTKAERKFLAYVCDLTIPLYKSSLDVKDERSITLQKDARYVLCNAGYQPCVNEVREEYRRWMKKANSDESNLISSSILYCVVYKWGTLEEFEFGLQRVVNFSASGYKKDHSRLLSYLAGCTRDEYRIERVLNVTVLENNGTFTEYDQRLIFNMQTGSAYGYTGLFKFVSKNWEAVKHRFVGKPGLWSYLLSRALPNFKTQEGLDLVLELYNSKKGQFGSDEPVVEAALHKIREEVKWSNKNLPVIEQWVDTYLSSTHVTS